MNISLLLRKFFTRICIDPFLSISWTTQSITYQMTLSPKQGDRDCSVQCLKAVFSYYHLPTPTDRTIIEELQSCKALTKEMGLVYRRLPEFLMKYKLKVCYHGYFSEKMLLRYACNHHVPLLLSIWHSPEASNHLIIVTKIIKNKKTDTVDQISYYDSINNHLYTYNFIEFKTIRNRRWCAFFRI